MSEEGEGGGGCLGCSRANFKYGEGGGGGRDDGAQRQLDGDLKGQRVRGRKAQGRQWRAR